MSGSDSDLEFESADEGGANEDVSDIDLSDLDEVTEEKKEETKVETKVEAKIEAKEDKNEEVKEQTLTLSETVKVDGPKIKEISEKTKIAPSRVEGDDDIEQMLNEMGINDSEIEHQTLYKPQETAPDQVNKKETNLETSNAPGVKKVELLKSEQKTGWDDNELEIDEDFIEETITLPSSNKEKNVTKEEKIETKSIHQEQPLPQLQQQPKNQNSGWSWSSFGTNFISTAVGSLNTVLETVEATIGAPDPAELAAKSKMHESSSKADLSKSEKIKEEQNEMTNDWNNDEGDSEWFSMPKLDKLTATSLNLLETVGKKTIEAINDKDPNFTNTRNFLSKVPATLVPIQSKPNLSQMLREAQQNQANSSPETPKPTITRLERQEKLTFSLFFDEYKGSAHLEALEMLSRQTSVKVEMIMLNKSNLNENKEKLESLEQYFDSDRLNDENDFNDSDTENDFKLLLNNKTKTFDPEHFEFLINEYAKKSNLKLVLDKVVGAFKTTSHAVKEITSIEELYNESIKCFALVTSNLIELYHKTAESVLIEQQNPKKNPNSSRPRVNPVENAEVLYNITKLSIRSVTILADDFSKKCKSLSKDAQNTMGNPNQVITDIYLEASNSSTYIGDAFLLFPSLFKSQILDKGTN